MGKQIEVMYFPDGRLVIRGRELYAALAETEPYLKWFSRMRAYGFRDGRDYRVVPHRAGRQCMDHEISIGMAREICLISQTENAKICREGLIRFERYFNAPDTVMERADYLREMAEKENAPEAESPFRQRILSCSRPKPIELIAQDYALSVDQMNFWLFLVGAVYRKDGVWLPYPMYVERGYCLMPSGGNTRVLWTQKGQLFIYDELKAAGCQPVEEWEPDYPG